MEKTTILYIIDTFCDLAGAERNLYETVTRLNKERYKPIVYALWAGTGTLIESLKQKGIQAKNLEMKRIYDFKAIKETIKLIRFVKKEHVKIVVTYHESSDFWGGIIAKLSGVPVVISSRRDMGYKLKKRHIILYRLINRIFDRILTVSDAVRDIIARREYVPRRKFITIHNGVDLEKFSKKVDRNVIIERLGLQPNRPIVGIVAAIRPIKGHKYFLKAASLILKEFPDVYFLVVGWHDNGPYFQELQDYVKELQIDKNVIFTGGRSDIPEILSILDVSVFSSLNEGFSNAVIESMAVGKPVVVTNTGGSPEAVIDGKTGFLVPPEDSEALANAILQVLKNKDLAHKMGEAERRRVERLFTLDRMIEDIETLYDVLLNSKTERKITLIRTKLSKLVKTLLGNILYYSGIIYIFEKLKSSNEIRILAYHKISDKDSYLNLNTKVESFRRQIEYLKQHYQIISLKAAVDLLKTKQKTSKKSIVITFDDGYRAIYKNAFPVLKEFNIPATIFLNVNPIENKEPLWFELIIYSIKNTSRRTIDIESFGLGKYLIDTIKERKKTMENITSYVKRLNKKDRNIFLNCLLNKLQVDSEELKEAGEDILSWDELREMDKEGVSIDVHGMTHTILTNMSLKEAEYEVCIAKKIIEERIGKTPHFFAYPNGGKDDFNEDIINILKDNEFLCGCSLIKGANNTDLFSLRRNNIYEGLTTDVFDSFSKSLFVVELLGVFEYLIKRFSKIRVREMKYI